MWLWGHEFKLWKQPFTMQDKATHNRLNVVRPFLTSRIGGSFYTRLSFISLKNPTNLTYLNIYLITHIPEKPHNFLKKNWTEKWLGFFFPKVKVLILSLFSFLVIQPFRSTFQPYSVSRNLMVVFVSDDVFDELKSTDLLNVGVPFGMSIKMVLMSICSSARAILDIEELLP